ncbi:MAG: endonuclease, partial [Deltaproteobacteria bacterium]|nr:endonuclease [Deltaproteobacteria bacterium]
MRIMTFNIRFENDRDGQNAWAHRKGLVARVIERYKPDIIGTQEGRWTQLLSLRDNLVGYFLNAPDRTIDSTCQYPTLFIRKDKLEI